MVIRCSFEKCMVAAFKGLFNILNNNIRFYIFNFVTQDILKEIDRLFDMNNLALHSKSIKGTS